MTWPQFVRLSTELGIADVFSETDAASARSLRFDRQMVVTGNSDADVTAAISRLFKFKRANPPPPPDSQTESAVPPVAARFDLFASYNSADGEAVAAFCEALTARGIQIWTDRTNLVAGALYAENLAEGMRASSGTIIFLGSGGLGPWQKLEIPELVNRFNHLQPGPVIPVRLEKDVRIVFPLTGFHCIDLWNMSHQDAVEKVFAAIQRFKRPPENGGETQT